MPLLELRPFDAGHGPDLRDISHLHARLLPDSPITILGARFRENFYYKDLPALGHIFGALAYVDNTAAGFVAGTLDSNGFMSAAFRKRRVKVLWLLGTAVLGDPRRLGAIWEASRINADRERLIGHGPDAELLSLGVLPQYRRDASQTGAGLQVGRSLVLHLMDTFRAKGVREARAIVDQDNPAAFRFYEKLGWRRGRSGIPGWRHPSAEVVWTPGAPLTESPDPQSGTPASPTTNQ